MHRSLGLLVLGAVLLMAAPACQSPAHAQVASQPYHWRNVEIGGGGGFVDGILFHPKKADLIYCRTDIGGVYRWEPTERRWIALTDWVGQENGNLRGGESIAVDPTDPSRVYIAAGTYSQPGLNTAILRSDDQGRTWKQSPLPIMMGGNEDGRSIGERLDVDPNLPSSLYFGSRHDGLWHSADYGATWAKVDSFPQVPDGRGTAGVGWITFDTKSGHAGRATPVIYAGVAASTVPGVYRSTDSGATWQPVDGQPTGWITHHGVFGPDHVLYVDYGNGIGPNGVSAGVVYKLDPSSGAWTDITPDKAAETGGGGFGGLSVDAQHPGTVMVATLDHWSPSDNVYRSTDGGAHWEALQDQATMDPAGAPWLRWGKPQPRFGWWIGALAIDPHHSGRVLYGTGATIWGTDDVTPADSGKPTHWKMYAEGVEETANTGLISPPAGAHLTSALGDIGGFTHWDLTVSPPEGMSFNPIFTTTSGLDFAAAAPNVIVRVGTGDDSDVTSGSRHGAYTSDGGHTWTPFATEPAGGRGGGAVAVTADGKSILWSPERGALSVSRDWGTTWTPCAGLAPANGGFFGRGGPQIVTDRVDPTKVYVLEAGAAALYASTDSGATFTPVATAAPLPQGNLHLFAAPDAAGDLWLTADDHGLWHSTDGGVTFTQAAAVGFASSVGFGKPAPGGAYPALYLIGTPAATGAPHGVYRSDDTGATWVRIDDDQHQYGWIDGEAITGDPRIYGRVYFGTNGRGVLYGDPADK